MACRFCCRRRKWRQNFVLFFYVLRNANIAAIGISAAICDDKGRANHDPWAWASRLVITDYLHCTVVQNFIRRFISTRLATRYVLTCWMLSHIHQLTAIENCQIFINHDNLSHSLLSSTVVIRTKDGWVLFSNLALWASYLNHDCNNTKLINSSNVSLKLERFVLVLSNFAVLIQHFTWRP